MITLLMRKFEAALSVKGTDREFLFRLHKQLLGYLRNDPMRHPTPEWDLFPLTRTFFTQHYL